MSNTIIVMLLFYVGMMQKLQMIYMSAVWANRISGSPYLNFLCIVL